MSQIAVPNTLADGQTIDSARLNANFTAIYAAFNSAIDNTNIGPAGLFASQIVPLTAVNATFGGALPYTFANGVQVTQMGTPSFVPPMVSQSGGVIPVTAHIVIGGASVTVGGGNVTLGLTGAAVFTGANTYHVNVTLIGGITTPIGVTVTYTSGSQFTVTTSNNAGQGVAGVNFTWTAEGY